MLIIKCFYKIFIIFFIAIRCAFALHDNPIFYKAEQHFMRGSFDTSQQLLNQLTQDHLLKKTLLMLVKKPCASDEKNPNNPLKKLNSVKKSFIYIDALVRQITDNTSFLWQTHGVQHYNMENCFKESFQALHVCLRVCHEYQHQERKMALIEKRDEFCQLAKKLITGNTYEKLLGAQIFNALTNIFSMPHIDSLFANHLSAQYDASNVRNQPYTEYAKRLYLRASTEDAICYSAFYSISLLYWKQLEYEQFFLWFSKSIALDNCCYSKVNKFVSTKLTALIQKKHYVDILLLLTAYRFTYYKNHADFKAKCKEVLLPNDEIDLFDLLKKRTSLWQKNNEMLQSTKGQVYSASCLSGLYFYIIGDYCNALKYLYHTFILDNDVQSYYYLLRLLLPYTKIEQHRSIITRLTPNASFTNEQSIFLQQLSTSQLLKLATIYLTMHCYDITAHLLQYIIDNNQFCFEVIGVQYLQGAMCELGYYYEKNTVSALRSYEIAANFGLPLAMYDLGRLSIISEETPLAAQPHICLRKAIKRKALQSPSSLHIKKSTPTKCNTTLTLE